MSKGHHGASHEEKHNHHPRRYLRYMYCVHTEEANLRLARARPLFLREITVATQVYSPRH